MQSPTMLKSEPSLKLDTGRRSFEIVVDGKPERWEYDVLEIKLIIESLERTAGMRVDDSPNVKNPTIEFLQALASQLELQECKGCTPTAAFRIYNVVNTQFATMNTDIQETVDRIVSGA
ncbi:hypothetical protein VN12_04390 [Pirellula sp. SH-Sr6A]|uniref:hypothetical protein n=1 Tax=Pirellula sp. SH-Sr6A TaxID=1632865 RepID=UPI00078B85DD|nr:hypothetical protein [Pirellula sp. SH-Sr6A]AMV31332.1 hypothetical protein VN12_04390 [Pirellula sp. SH-Sr6A]